MNDKKIFKLIAELGKKEVELKSEDIELKNIATLDKLYEQSTELIPELKKLQKWNNHYMKTKQDNAKKLDKQQPKVSKEQSKVRDLEKKLEAAKDNLRFETNELDSIKKSVESNKDFLKDIAKADTKYGKKNTQIRKQFEQNISAFEKAARSLGFEPKTGKYEKMLNQLRSLPAS